MANISRQTLRTVLSELEKTGRIDNRNGKRHLVSTEDWLASSMSRTMVILSDFEITFDTTMFGHTGFNSFVGVGAICEIQQTGFSALTVHPSQLTRQKLENICKQRPIGALYLEDQKDLATIRWALEMLAAHDIPCVAYGPQVHFPNVDTVYADHHKGAYKLVNKLNETGCQRIQRLWLGHDMQPGVFPWLDERDAGFEQACRDLNLPITDALRMDFLKPSGRDEEHFQTSVRHLAGMLIELFTSANRPDAIMANSDSVVPLIHAALRVFGLEPNKDVLVTGFDHYWIDNDMRFYEAMPPWASVDKQHISCGRQMVRLLDQRLKKQLPEESQHLLVEPNIIDSQELEQLSHRCPPRILEDTRGDLTSTMLI